MSQGIVISSYLTGIFTLTGHPGINCAYFESKIFENESIACFLLPLPSF